MTDEEWVGARGDRSAWKGIWQGSPGVEETPLEVGGGIQGQGPDQSMGKRGDGFKSIL